MTATITQRKDTPRHMPPKPDLHPHPVPPPPHRDRPEEERWREPRHHPAEERKGPPPPRGPGSTLKRNRG